MGHLAMKDTRRTSLPRTRPDDKFQATRLPWKRHWRPREQGDWHDQQRQETCLPCGDETLQTLHKERMVWKP